MGAQPADDLHLWCALKNIDRCTNSLLEWTWNVPGMNLECAWNVPEMTWNTPGMDLE